MASSLIRKCGCEAESRSTRLTTAPARKAPRMAPSPPVAREPGRRTCNHRVRGPHPRWSPPARHNASSGDLSVFATGEDALTLLHTIPSGGTPRSVTEQGGLIYVLNTEGPSLAGFRLQDGGLDPIPDTPRALPDGSDPAQVGFSPDGTGIVVTNRGTDSITTLYAADESGRLGEPVEQPSSGPTPYGFAFANDGTLVVTEAFGAQKGKAAASSYVLSSGSIRPVSRSVGNGAARSAGPS